MQDVRDMRRRCGSKAVRADPLWGRTEGEVPLLAGKREKGWKPEERIVRRIEERG